MAPARGFEIAARLALEEIADAAADMRRLAGDAEEPVAVRIVGLGPDRAARAAPVHDAMRHAAQRHSVPCANGAACGRRLRRAAIQPPCFCAKSRASFRLPRGGMVSTTSREAASMRSV